MVMKARWAPPPGPTGTRGAGSVNERVIRGGDRWGESRFPYRLDIGLDTANGLGIL